MMVLRTFSLSCVLLAFSLTSFAVSEHNHGPEEEEHGNQHGDAHDESLVITPANLQRSGIVQNTAKTGELQRRLRLYGFLREDPARISHIRARFPGILRSVKVQTGDFVSEGQVLAEVESSQSLSIYPIRAPFAGQITERHANPGELTLEQSLFTLNDKRKLFVELQVFSGQLREVRPGLPLEIHIAGQPVHSKVLHLLPSGQNNGTVVARALLNNADNLLQPGMFAEADVLLPAGQRGIVVENSALQSLEGRQVVFSCDASGCRALPVETGPSDGAFTLIHKGLQAGETYVASGSYLLKAELEKSSAGHSH
ncbi:MAG: efflux RND transporter periplasmic adaptor subunit [Oceanospirillaceae bacterium]|nr:efflux RND transporter periplasmic adaptor subunit [Oceanospirillaceae bacterium]MCP5349392.1 efflux RND transporter periplasmic adaptor subunit [Oceanospirillaceae bacterium]